MMCLCDCHKMWMGIIPPPCWCHCHHHCCCCKPIYGPLPKQEFEIVKYAEQIKELMEKLRKETTTEKEKRRRRKLNEELRDRLLRAEQTRDSAQNEDLQIWNNTLEDGLDDAN